MDNTEKKTDNVLKFPNSNWALFNDNVRKTMKSHIKRVTDIDDTQAERAIDGAESAMLYHLAVFSRKLFSDLGERCAKALFENK